MHRLEPPVTPLSSAALLTNAPEEPSLGAELRAELASADRVDLLCAFIRWHGVRVLEQQLDVLRSRGVPFRVITTTYVGATEQRAVDALVRRFGAHVKISYETRSTRLHAKAWLFHRSIGLRHGVRRQQQPLPVRPPRRAGVERAAVVGGDAGPAAQVRRHVRQLLGRARTSWTTTRTTPTTSSGLRPALGRDRITTAGQFVSGLEVRPLPVSGRRSSRRSRPSGPCTTGTATWSSRRPAPARPSSRRSTTRGCARACRATGCCSSRTARRSSSSPGALPRGAGRRRVRRAVRRRGAPGALGARVRERAVAGCVRGRAASARTTSTSWSSTSSTTPQAPTYRRLLEHLQPRELLGLTATPERADGVDVREFFDGRTADELRLWDALSADLLVPFHYFGVADDVDLQRIEWKRGSYDASALDAVYTGNDARAAKIVRETRDKVTDVRRDARPRLLRVASRTRATWPRCSPAPGSPASRSPADTARGGAGRARCAKLRTSEVNCLFAVDLFNEGLDVPRGRHGAVPAPDPERDRLPAAARSRSAPRAGQGGADRRSTSSASTAVSSASTSATAR